eukprot:g5482.t1
MNQPGPPPFRNEYQGRGRGAGRVSPVGGRPDSFDASWWEPPPTIGPDPFLRGYSAKIYPRYGQGYGGLPYGGYGGKFLSFSFVCYSLLLLPMKQKLTVQNEAAHHFWGGPAYHYPGQGAWWQGHSGAGAVHPRFYGSGGQPSFHTRDSMGLGHGGTFALASPYYFTPPAISGDWNFPKNPPPPPGAAAEEK